MLLTTGTRHYYSFSRTNEEDQESLKRAVMWLLENGFKFTYHANQFVHTGSWLEDQLECPVKVPEEVLNSC